MAEMLEDRSLGIRALRPEIGDFHRVLQGKTGGHDLAEDARHCFVTERAGISRQHGTQHLGLAFGAIEVGPLSGLRLDRRDLARALGALADQGLDLLVDLVDAGPYLLKLVFTRHARAIPGPTVTTTERSAHRRSS